MDLKEKEKIEIDYWKDSDFENPEVFTKENYLNKSQEATHFNYKLQKYISQFKGKENVLELGGGQGWASCFFKKYFLPDANFICTDISPFAIKSIHNWEHIYNVKIDSSFSCKSYDIPLEDDSVDLIFCYAAFHHFVKYKETIQEAKRILKPNGVMLFLYEPVSSKFFYPLYYKYVNTAPHSTPEDVLIPKNMKSYCASLDLDCEVVFDSHQSINRSWVIMLYFGMLKRVLFLARYMPASADFIIRKKKHS